MKLMNLDSAKSYSMPDLYLNIGHLLDHFMMLIFAKAAFDAGREFGFSYEGSAIGCYNKCKIKIQSLFELIWTTKQNVK